MVGAEYLGTLHLTTEKLYTLFLLFGMVKFCLHHSIFVYLFVSFLFRYTIHDGIAVLVLTFPYGAFL